jgi:hypothetical protein
MDCGLEATQHGKKKAWAAKHKKKRHGARIFYWENLVRMQMSCCACCWRCAAQLVGLGVRLTIAFWVLVYMASLILEFVGNHQGTRNLKEIRTRPASAAPPREEVRAVANTRAARPDLLMIGEFYRLRHE